MDTTEGNVEPQYEHLSLPASQIARIMKQAAPDATISKDAKTAVDMATKVFIHFLANGAFERARSTKRTKLTIDDVTFALQEYGFEDMIDTVRAAVEAANSSKVTTDADLEGEDAV